jgi:hypothetical protein
MNFENTCMAREGLAAVVSMNRGGRAREVGAGHAQPAGSKPFLGAETLDLRKNAEKNWEGQRSVRGMRLYTAGGRI